MRGECGQCLESYDNGFRERVPKKTDGISCEKSFTGQRKKREICQIPSSNCEPKSGTQSNIKRYPSILYDFFAVAI